MGVHNLLDQLKDLKIGFTSPIKLFWSPTDEMYAIGAGNGVPATVIGAAASADVKVYINMDGTAKNTIVYVNTGSAWTALSD